MMRRMAVLGALGLSGCVLSSIESHPSVPLNANAGPGMGPQLAQTPATPPGLPNAVPGTANENGFVSSIRGAATSLASSLEIKPQTISAADPVSLGTDTPQVGADLHLQAARLYESQKNIPQAVSHYQQALAASPDDPRILTAMARMFDRQNQWGQAEALYQKALETNPQDASLLNDLALCYARQKRLDEAVWALGQATQVDPQSPLYRNNLASVFVEMGNVDEALQQLVAVLPPAAAHYNVGYLLSRKGQSELAEQQFVRALQIDPTLAAAQKMLDSLRPAASTQSANRAGVPRSADLRATPGIRRLPPVY